LVPYYNAYIAYDPTHPIEAIADPTFANSFAFFLIYMGVLCLIFLIASIRTNLVFFLIFALLVPAFGCLAAAFWHLAAGDAVKAQLLQHVGAGLAFAVCILGWYLFAVQLLVAVDFPLDLPVVDLSHLIRGGTDKKQARQQRTDEEANGVQQPLGQRLKFWKKA
jgi:succinate-acetate transporter protein